MNVYFVELAGENAFDRLETLKKKLESLGGVQSLKLLKNTQQPDLYLLVIETSEEAHIEAPEGSRVWTFVES
jgi:heme-degrading monooxygenase HmoA